VFEAIMVVAGVNSVKVKAKTRANHVILFII
jgi:hypothetical protein